MKRLALLTMVVLGLAVLVLYGCHDSTEVTEPSAVVTAATYTLTVSGSGTGSGVVKSTPLGISCTITDGHAALHRLYQGLYPGTDGHADRNSRERHRVRRLALNVLVCKSLGTCTFKMTANRTVSAVFRKGPFTVRITSGSQGPGPAGSRASPGSRPP